MNRRTATGWLALVAAIAAIDIFPNWRGSTLSAGLREAHPDVQAVMFGAFAGILYHLFGPRVLPNKTVSLP